MSFVSDLVEDGRRIVATGDGRAWQIEPVKSADLARYGHAELVGASDVAAALADAQSDQRAAADAVKVESFPAGSPERLEAEARLKAREARAAESQSAQLVKALTKTPERIKAFSDRLDAYICAAVTAAGYVAEGHGEAGEIDAAACEGGALDPVRFCMEKQSEALDAPIPLAWVGRIPEGIRQTLALQIIEANSARRLVRRFRGES